MIAAPDLPADAYILITMGEKKYMTLVKELQEIMERKGGTFVVRAACACAAPLPLPPPIAG